MTRPLVPPFPAGVAVRRLGVYVPNEARHSSEGRGGIPCHPLQDRLEAATTGLEPPFAVVDLDAFDANAADLLARARGKPVRLASKSVRCRALIDRALGAGLSGVLAFTLPEALWLAAVTRTWWSPTRPSTARRCASWRARRRASG